jgi:CheY-like chemotaxis protein
MLAFYWRAACGGDVAYARSKGEALAQLASEGAARKTVLVDCALGEVRSHRSLKRRAPPGSAAEACRLANESSYDAIILGIRMPVLDGLAAARRIRGTEGLAAERP